MKLIRHNFALFMFFHFYIGSFQKKSAKNNHEICQFIHSLSLQTCLHQSQVSISGLRESSQCQIDATSWSHSNAKIWITNSTWSHLDSCFVGLKIAWESKNWRKNQSKSTLISFLSKVEQSRPEGPRFQANYFSVIWKKRRGYVLTLIRTLWFIPIIWIIRIPRLIRIP